MKLCSAIVLCLVFTASYAQFRIFASPDEPSFESARLVQIHREDRLKCPSSDDESAVIFCNLQIDASGELFEDRSQCIGNVGPDDRRAGRLMTRLSRSEFSAARIDGEAVGVYAPIRLLFEETGGDCQVTVIPNLGNELNDDPAGYVAPQEVRSGGNWRDRFREYFPLLEVNDGPYRPGIAFMMSVAVDSLGFANDGRIEVNELFPDATGEVAVKSLEQSEFIPATVDGSPRSSRYYQYLIRR